MPESEELGELYRRKSVEQPLLSYNWYILLPKLHETSTLDESVVYGDGGMLAEALPSLREDYNRAVSTRVQSLTSPYFKVDTDKNFEQNTYWYYAKANDISSISFDVIENEDMLTLDYFTAWKNLIINSDGTNNPPAYYKKEIIVYRMNNLKSDVAVHIYSGCFVSDMADLTTDYETSDFVKYNITLSVDSGYFTSIEYADGDPRISEVREAASTEQESGFGLFDIIDGVLAGVGTVKTLQSAF